MGELAITLQSPFVEAGNGVLKICRSLGILSRSDAHATITGYNKGTTGTSRQESETIRSVSRGTVRQRGHDVQQSLTLAPSAKCS